MGIFDKLFGSRALEQKQTVNVPKEPEQIRNSTACPHCGVIFAAAPTRKKKCPECYQDVYVRSKQHIFSSHLLNKEDAYTSDFYDQLINLGATLEDYREAERELQKQWGFRPNSYDVAWSVSNQLPMKPIKETGSLDQQTSSLMRAEFVAWAQAQYQLRRGHDPAPYLQNAHDYKLQQLQSSGSKFLKLKGAVIATHGCCEACGKYEGRKYNVAQLKQKSVLPIRECIHRLEEDDKYTWCVCLYVAEYE